MTLQLPRRRFVALLTILAAAVSGVPGCIAEPLTFQRAIELALVHSTGSAIAKADVQRALAAYHEVRNTYAPQVTVGSGLGYSYGFPLSLEGSAPALVNVVAQSTIFNPAQQQFMRAAKTEWQASESQSKDQRNSILQDVALSYAELAKWEARLTRLKADEAQAQQMESAVALRVEQGIDSNVDRNKAKLTAARVRLHVAEARGSADLLRLHLGELTGLPARSIEIAPETIPALPALPAEDDSASEALATSPALKFTEQHAIAQAFRASAEHRALLPSLDFAGQYARLSTYNNYDQYFKKFQPNNVTIGMSFRLPIFNAAQRARAREADAESMKARKQAEAARTQIQDETLKLQRTVEQLDAAREVAQLEFQLAQTSVETAQTRSESQSGTLHELADARAQASERYLAQQDAEFEYQRARLNLLRATGNLERWALESPPTLQK
jgi:outer membrane protein TolC